MLDFLMMTPLTKIRQNCRVPTSWIFSNCASRNFWKKLKRQLKANCEENCFSKTKTNSLNQNRNNCQKETRTKENPVKISLILEQ
jgi:hypothetical protein